MKEWEVIEHSDETIEIIPLRPITDGYRRITVALHGVYIVIRYGIKYERKAGVTVEMYKDTEFTAGCNSNSGKDITFNKYLSIEDVFDEEPEEPPYNRDEDVVDDGVRL
jgi:hypothetical protein